MFSNIIAEQRGLFHLVIWNCCFSLLHALQVKDNSTRSLSSFNPILSDRQSISISIQITDWFMEKWVPFAIPNGAINRIVLISKQTYFTKRKLKNHPLAFRLAPRNRCSESKRSNLLLSTIGNKKVSSVAIYRWTVITRLVYRFVLFFSGKHPVYFYLFTVNWPCLFAEAGFSLRSVPERFFLARTTVLIVSFTAAELFRVSCTYFPAADAVT